MGDHATGEPNGRLRNPEYGLRSGLTDRPARHGACAACSASGSQSVPRLAAEKVAAVRGCDRVSLAYALDPYTAVHPNSLNKPPTHPATDGREHGPASRAPGSPMRAFLREGAALDRRGLLLGEAALFSGVRSRPLDYLYRDEVAGSSPTPKSSYRAYVPYGNNRS